MLLISINGMVGSAWLFGPFYSAQIAGAGAIISWVLGGIITIVIALTFAELSTLLPISGGIARFPQLSHGTLTNLTMTWVFWLSCVTMPPIEVQSTLQYASTYFPSLTHMVNGVHVITPYGYVWATLLMLMLSFLNVTSFKSLIGVNNVLFMFKLTVMALTIFALIHTQFHTNNFTRNDFDSSKQMWEAILTAVATGGIAFAFTGFTHGVALAGETKNSQIAVPLGIIGSVLICLILYLGLQVAFIGAISPDALAHGWKNLSFAGEAGPFVGIAALLGLGWLVKILYADSVVSPLGAGFIYVTSTARIVYAMSKNGYFPSFLTKLNKNHFPIYAIALNFFLGMFLFLPFPGWQAMVSFLVSAVVIAYAMGPISLLCLRLQLPNEKRPFRLPAAHFISALAFYFCNLICYWTGWQTISKLAIAILIGMVLLIIAYLRGAFRQGQFGFRAAYWIVPYLLGLFIVSYLGPYGGGKDVIKFGWDFLIIAIFSFAIILLAVATRLKSNQEQFLIYREEQNLSME